MQPGARRTPPLPLILLGLAAAGAIVAGVLLLGPPSSQSSGTTIRLASVGRGVVQQTVTASGNVEPLNEVGLNFKASGILTTLYVSAGQNVKAGQLLAEIDPTSAQVALEQAQANLKSAQANLAQVEATGSSATASRSSATTASVRLTAVQLTGATGVSGPTGATSPATGATGTPATTPAVKHKKPNKKKKPASAPSATTTPQKPSLGSGRKSAPTGATGAGSTSSGSTATPLSPAAIAANLATAQAAVATDQLTVKSDQTALSGTKLYATMSGTVASISGAVGSAVTAGGAGSNSGGSGNSGAGNNSSASAIASALGSSNSSSASSSSGSSATSGFIVIAQMSPMKMDVSVAEANIGQVHVGQPATVSIDAITNLELAAKVTSISVLPTSSSGVVSYDVTLELTQSDPRMRPGMSASATIVVAQADDAVTVQSAAISSSGSTSTVTVDNNGKAVVTSVIAGLVGTNATQIVAGLKPGQTVEIPITTRLATAAASTVANRLAGLRTLPPCTVTKLGQNPATQEKSLLQFD